MSGDVLRNAELSPCGTYRYRLGRRWSDEPADVWVMLNPSTADAELDDPTIRRCVGFSRAWGAGGIEVVNLFALRATDPAVLLRHPDPIGPDNDATIACAVQQACGSGRRVVAAWGAHPMARYRASMLRLNAVCLGRTASGAPKHPLYVKADTEPQRWAA